MPYKELGTRLKKGIQSKVDALRDGAPKELDTFKETAEAISSINKYQKYVNTELDYGVFQVADMNVNSTTPLVFSSVVTGNIELSEKGYIKLQANKTYVFHVNLHGIQYETEIRLVDSSLKTIAECVTSQNGSYIYKAYKDIEVTFVTNTDGQINSKLSCVNVYEINRQIVIDPIEHINYFNPSLYSEEETVIGCWVDGKPLYQKTITTKVPKVATQIALNISNLHVENIINFISNFSNNEIINTAPNISGDNYLGFWYNKTAKLLHITCTEDSWFGWDLYITIQYTKLTDEKNSFTSDMLNYIEGPSLVLTHYSDEDVTNAVNALW